MEVNIVCHFSKVLSKENGEMSLSALGGHVSELNTKQKKYLKKIGFNKFLMDHPNNFILFDDTVILLPAENSPQETKPSPHTLSLPSPIAISNIIKDIQTSNCCTVCLESMEIFAFGPCFHPVCYSCSTKLRVLCDEKLCHICRSHLPEIVFTKQLVPMGELNLTNCIKEQKYGIYFENTETRNKHRKLLEHLCPRCTKKFGDFDDLQNHLKLKHGEYFCSICVQQCK
uniref:Uncharacterized protein n=1 Tax=Ciona savignyi TaxID=51511 RepID=H2ZR44_CIOSA